MSQDDVSANLMERYFSNSRSFRLFDHSLHHIRHLLQWALKGLEEGEKASQRLAAKIEAAEAGTPVQHDPSVNSVQISVDEKELAFLKRILASAQKLLHDPLHLYLHNVLLVALWSSFESYLQGIIGQVFIHNVSALATEKQVTYRELIEHRLSPVEYLIEREIEYFGRLSLEAMVKFVKGRIKYDFNADELCSLREVYFLRNVIAHNSGFVRPSQQQLVPADIGIKNNQIDISGEYLERQMVAIEAAAKRMDEYVIGRWNVPKSLDALFDDIPSVLTDAPASTEPRE